MNVRTIYLAIFLLLCTGQPVFAQSGDWVYKGEKDGVKVYLRMQGTVYDVKLTTSIQTSLSAFCHLMADVEAYPNWGYKVYNTDLIDQTDEYNRTYYSRMDFPWPLNDRDVTLQSTMTQSANGVVTFDSKSIGGLRSEVKDVIRMDDVETKWVIHPPKNGWCYLEYYIHSNPEGNLPEWLVNAAIDMGPRETITSIRRELKKSKYQTIRLAYIRD
jgi:START domain